MKKNILKKVFSYIKKYIPHLILALCENCFQVLLYAGNYNEYRN